VELVTISLALSLRDVWSAHSCDLAAAIAIWSQTRCDAAAKPVGIDEEWPRLQADRAIGTKEQSGSDNFLKIRCCKGPVLSAKAKKAEGVRE